jgi:hypothetical protein
MRTLAKLLGAVIGIAISVVFSEVIFPNNQDWPIIFIGVGAAAGWLLAAALLARRGDRGTSQPSADV